MSHHVCLAIIIIQEKCDGVYNVSSCSDSDKQYEVVVNAQLCPDKPACIPQCTSDKCHYLCRHMISCTCFDYAEWHLCKHCHKVWCTRNDMKVVMDNQVTNVTYGYDPEVKVEKRAGIIVVILYTYFRLI